MSFPEMWAAMSWTAFLAMFGVAVLLGGGMAASYSEHGDPSAAVVAFLVTFVTAFIVWLLVYWVAQTIWVGFEPLRTK